MLRTAAPSTGIAIVLAAQSEALEEDARLLEKRHEFEPYHRQDTRHEIEDEPGQKSDRQDGP